MDKKVMLQVQELKKKFKLSAKQQKLEKTNDKIKVAVDGLSFTAYEGEIFGLLGPNGAGKTTTLRLLATLIRPDAGDALVDGCSICKEPEKVRQRIGFLTSELKLEDFFTPNYLFDFLPRCTEFRQRFGTSAKNIYLGCLASTILQKSR